MVLAVIRRWWAVWSRGMGGVWGCWLGALLVLVLGWSSWTGVAQAGLTDDRYDGNIFALYAGNGSLVPPRVTLAQSLQQGKPAILVFYVDDSGDCKQFAGTISQLQGPYGRAANFIPVMADAATGVANPGPTEPGYYFGGKVPQTVIFDGAGQVRFNGEGQVSYEAMDDVLREIFDLLPRQESVELRRRAVNEVNTELVPES